MIRFFIFISLSLITLQATAQTNIPLRQEIQDIIQDKKATVGVAIIFDGTDTLTVNNQYRYPTMSVYKFHQALAVLDYLNKHNLPLEQQVYISKSALLPETHSPLRDKKPEGNFYMPIKELMQYSVSQSDNNACDILFNFLGGTAPVEQYIKNLGIQQIAITKTEQEMSEDFDNQYGNWTTPYAAVQLLEIFLQQELFASNYKIFLSDALIQTSTGKDKIKGLLPSGTIVGHKTGMSSRNSNGVKAGDNNLGFIKLPNNKNLSIAVFIVNSTEDDTTNAKIIAQISKAAYDYFKVK
uniref:class A beta-lactamase, subclass A2 n=1 Tax=uncultured Dysgonomonas sp. TaxID=206096 RepID=UPI00262A8162|nr:class A beta-lactamase, subclass A2 [uncultured Dysgonomonas sp.]